MSKLTGINTDMSGRVGKYVFRQTPLGTIVSQAPRKPKIPRRSEQQQNRRTLLGNLAAFYRLFEGSLRRGFEGTPAGQHAFNAFVKANINQSGVYITKSEKTQGGAVVAPYLITCGSIASIAAELQSGTLVSDIKLAGLTIDERTKVRDFASAVVAANRAFRLGDALTFFLLRQSLDRVTGVPRVEFLRCQVKLELGVTTPLWEVVDKSGFFSVNNYLGMGMQLEDAGAAWVHSRHADDSTPRVSTQSLIVNNRVLDNYTGDEARIRAIESYGGINNEAVYFEP
jgi:hypothetical protein